jgi:hypothetical protein
MQFISRNTSTHLERHGPRTRYPAFALTAFAACEPSERRDEFISQFTSWLTEARNSDGGWGTQAGDQQSTLFTTATVLTALQLVGAPAADYETSYQWLLARRVASGWALHPGTAPGPVATAYATLALVQSPFSEGEWRAVALRALTETRHWGSEEEVIPGTIWKHCTFAWVVPALVALGEPPHSRVIAEAIIAINKLRSSHGGWNESEPGVGRTIRSQYWAVRAMEGIILGFDPAVHVLRIDQERTSRELSEPDFITIKSRGSYATIVSSRIYRWFTYALAALALSVLLGVHRLAPQLSTRVDALAALALLAGSWYLIQKRPKQFPKLAKIVGVGVAVLSTLGLVFGTDLSTVAEFTQTLLQKAVDLALRLAAS